MPEAASAVSGSSRQPGAWSAETEVGDGDVDEALVTGQVQRGALLGVEVLDEHVGVGEQRVEVGAVGQRAACWRRGRTS